MGRVFCIKKDMKRKNSFHVFFYAAEKTRTSTVLLPLAPEASASANSATTAIINHFFILAQNKDFNKKKRWETQRFNHDSKNLQPL